MNKLLRTMAMHNWTIAILHLSSQQRIWQSSLGQFRPNETCIQIQAPPSRGNNTKTFAGHVMFSGWANLVVRRCWTNSICKGDTFDVSHGGGNAPLRTGPRPSKAPNPSLLVVVNRETGSQLVWGTMFFRPIRLRWGCKLIQVRLEISWLGLLC
jgi:hypothetical protein